MRVKSRPTTGVKGDNKRARLTVHVDGSLFDLIQEGRHRLRKESGVWVTQSQYVAETILEPWSKSLKWK
jgi:hypothetical protein